MAKIATTKSDKAAGAAKVAAHPRAADVAHDPTDKAQGTTLRLIAKAAATAEDRARTGSPATAKPSVVLPTQAVGAAFEMLKAGAAVAGFWLQQGNDQLAHQARTLRKLAAARDWRERLEIQSSFLHDSLSRLNQGVARHVDVNGAMTAGSREARAAAAASNAGQQR
jgi:hypothetical protein